MKVKGIQLSWIVVSNIETALKFYTDVVGLNILEYNKEFGWAELAGPEGARLGLAQANPEMEQQPGSNAVPTITVDDIDAVIAVYKKKNVRLIGEKIVIPGIVSMQTFTDADGNTFQICQLYKTLS